MAWPLKLQMGWIKFLIKNIKEKFQKQDRAGPSLLAPPVFIPSLSVYSCLRWCKVGISTSSYLMYSFTFHFDFFFNLSIGMIELSVSNLSTFFNVLLYADCDITYDMFDKLKTCIWKYKNWSLSVEYIKCWTC